MLKEKIKYIVDVISNWIAGLDSHPRLKFWNLTSLCSKSEESNGLENSSARHRKI